MIDLYNTKASHVEGVVGPGGGGFLSRGHPEEEPHLRGPARLPGRPSWGVWGETGSCKAALRAYLQVGSAVRGVCLPLAESGQRVDTPLGKDVWFYSGDSVAWVGRG